MYYACNTINSHIGNLSLHLHLNTNKMERIFSKSTLREYWETHPETEQYLKTWFDMAVNSDWKTPNDVKQTFATASILKDNRIVFNIKDNSYRLIAKFNYQKQWIFIRFIGTHKAYDEIDANTI